MKLFIIPLLLIGAFAGCEQPPSPTIADPTKYTSAAADNAVADPKMVHTIFYDTRRSDGVVIGTRTISILNDAGNIVARKNEFHEWLILDTAATIQAIKQDIEYNKRVLKALNEIKHLK